MSKYLTRIFEEASSVTRSKSVSPNKNEPDGYRSNTNSPNNNIISNPHHNKYDTTNNQSIVRPVPIKFDNSYNTSHPIRYDDYHSSTVLYDNHRVNNKVQYDAPVRYLDNLTFNFDSHQNSNFNSNPQSFQNIRFTNGYSSPPINTETIVRFDDTYAKQYSPQINTIPTYNAPLPSTNYSNTGNNNISRIQEVILNAKTPVPIDETSTINLKVNGPNGPNEIRGIWVNKDECLNWRGPIPLDQYKINLNTADAQVIRKHATHSYDQVQNISVKYLKPPKAQAPGDLIIREEPNVQLPPAPPIIIRQQAAILRQPPPRLLRERPPRPPPNVPTQTISIPGKTIDPPPRQVIVERMAAEVQAPQDVVIERWLGYPKQKRNVVHKRAQSQAPAQAPRNVIIDWETTGRVDRVTQKMNFLGVDSADPLEYERRYGSELVDSHRLPADIVNKLEVPQGEYLAANNVDLNEFILTGDVNALKLIDTKRNDLSQYLTHKF